MQTADKEEEQLKNFTKKYLDVYNSYKTSVPEDDLIKQLTEKHVFDWKAHSIDDKQDR